MGDKSWKLSLGDGVRAPSRCSVAAGDTASVLTAITRAKARCGLAGQVPVRSCYEAGRDGFWLHRWLTEQGIANLVVDSASIEVNRRARRAKTDRLDSDKLLSMLMRYHAGERRVWAVARIPSPEQEDERRVHRELGRLRQERTAHSNRIRSLLVLHNLRVERIGGRAGWAGGLSTPCDCCQVCAPRLSASSNACRWLPGRSGRWRHCSSIRSAAVHNPRSHCSPGWQVSAREVHGPWSRNCLAGGGSTTGVNLPAAWAWRRRPTPVAPATLSSPAATQTPPPLAS
ncbi:transposase [Variovorax sp. WDL1]|nr:transposase [Variovorax sp. WDL1]